MTVTCSRCGKDTGEPIPGPDTVFTAGFYVVREGYWAEFAKPGEEYLCDACMWVTPEYIKRYGKMETSYVNA